MNIHYYKTSGGKNLILDYINSLSKPEIIDGVSVIECFEKGELDKLTIKQWQGKYGKFTFTSITEYSMLLLMTRTFICSMLAESRKTRQRKQTAT